MLLRPRGNSRFACPECGRMITSGGITDHVRRHHGMSMRELREKHNILSRSHDPNLVMAKAHAASRGRRAWNREYENKFTEVACHICGDIRKMLTRQLETYRKKGLTRFTCGKVTCANKLRAIRVKEARGTAESKAKTSAASIAQWAKNHDAHASACLKGMRASAKYASPERMAKALATAQAAPTKPEQMVIDFVTAQGLPYKYVGNGALFVEKLNPDLVSTEGPKRVILVRGCYWHGCAKCYPAGRNRGVALPIARSIYGRNGYQVIVIWEHELKSSAWQAKLLSVVD